MFLPSRRRSARGNISRRLAVGPCGNGHWVSVNGTRVSPPEQGFKHDSLVIVMTLHLTGDSGSWSGEKVTPRPDRFLHQPSTSLLEITLISLRQAYCCDKYPHTTAHSRIVRISWAGSRIRSICGHHPLRARKDLGVAGNFSFTTAGKTYAVGNADPGPPIPPIPNQISCAGAK